MFSFFLPHCRGTGWLKRTITVLHQEPETWLAYLYGQQFERCNHLKEAKPRYRGLVLRLATFFYLLVRDSRRRRMPRRPGQHTILVYAGTANQRDSLDATVDALHRKGAKPLALAEPTVIISEEHKERYLPLHLGPLEVAKTTLLFLFRFRLLLRSLRSKHSRLITRNLNTFCKTYCYLVYFERLLREVRPAIVLVSNDHNVSNRSLMAMARVMGIKTAYMQHASVSPLFPALSFDYSFLDGRAALECYRQCEANCSPSATLPTHRHVFLTGQKKLLGGSGRNFTGAIGIAINTLDSPDDIAPVLDALDKAGCRLHVRWHPAMKGRKLKPLMSVLKAYPRVSLSNPAEEPVGRFLSQVDGLIAGNSSIHLEAALTGVVPVYYELSPANIPDYYGYARLGISKRAETLSDLVRIVCEIQEGHVSLNPGAIRHYSATFGTEWEGREGELVAGHLAKLVQSDDVESLWGYIRP